MTCRDLVLDVLGPTAVDHAETHSFIGLGGDSLRAIQFVSLARERLGVAVSMTALLGAEPVVRVVETAHPVPVVVEDAAPAGQDERDTAAMSHAQRGMWLIEKLTGGSPYNLVFTCFTEDSAALDEGLLERAVVATVARHEGLRSVFAETDDDVVRVVLPDWRPVLERHVHLGDPEGFDDAVRDIVHEASRIVFDLAATPGLRVLAVRGPDRSAFALVAHHTTLDGFAVGLVLNEIAQRYGQLADGVAPDAMTADREPAVGPGALARHDRTSRGSGQWDRDAQFWSEHLAGVPTVVELPADQQRPTVQDAAGDRTSVDLGPDRTSGVVTAARAVGITPFALLLAAFGLTLARRTGDRSLLVGVPLLGRRSRELEQVVAVAGNLIPVCIDVDDDAEVGAYLRAVQHSLTLSIEAGHLPYEELVERLRIERAVRCHPLVQFSFGMHDQLVPQRLYAGPSALRVEEGHGGGSQFDLSLLIGHSDPSLAGHVEYATGVLTADEVDALVADFANAVEGLSADPTAAMHTVRAVDAARLDAAARSDACPYVAPDTTLDRIFRDVVARNPDVVAVRDDTHSLTYRELGLAAERQAALLQGAGVAPGDLVVVALNRSVAEVVAVLGTVLAGAAYIGVDLSLPVAHNADLVRRARASAVVVDSGAADSPALDGVPVVEPWTPDQAALPAPPAVAVVEPGDPERLAYVAFTSGSTGRPKGVCVPHRAVIRLVVDADFVALGPGARMLRLSPMGFDASTLEMWGPLLTGATMEIYPAELPVPRELAAFLAEREVTVAWLTAGLFRLVQEFAPDAWRPLRQVLTGGDVVPHEHVARALTRFPHLVVTNGYGPTENTTFTTTHTVRAADEVDGPLPIGTPLQGTTVHVLDDRGRPVPPGAAGELFTGGAGLALGYLDDQAETDRRFGRFAAGSDERLYRTGDLVRLDGGGRLRFLGRADDQVKLRGYRVELSAIAASVSEQPGVDDAVAFVTDGDSAGKRVVAALVPTPGARTTVAAVRDALTERLPDYMIPALWAVVESIPLTTNGKVDRAALAALAVPVSHGAVAPAAAPAESAVPPAAVDDLLDRVAALFADVVDRDDADVAVDADTDFFRFGGNSLGAVQLMRRVKQDHGVTVRLREFLIAPTPAGLSSLIEKAGVS